MTARFDESGNLWVDVELGLLPPYVIHSAFATSSPGLAPGTFTAVTQINLTDYIRKLMRPDWVNAALTSSSAQVTIVGNTPTTGGKLDYSKWLATIPEPIEPGT